jgi:hypothetical protein
MLYVSDWSAGKSGWIGSPDWQVIDGRLLSDGSHQEYGVLRASISAPVDLAQANYAVEAEIRRVRWSDEGKFTGKGSFGLAARITDVGGYAAGVCAASGFLSCPGGPNGLVIVASEEPERAPLATREYTDDGDWHVYRLEVDGTAIRLLIDGSLVLKTSDQRFLAPGLVGLWANGAQIEVRRFVVVGL